MFTHMKLLKSIISLGILLFVLGSCGPDRRKGVDYEQFGSYWFQGMAEISSFDLVQYRYGEPRQGETVLIFVTEDFSKKNQVKLDDYEAAGGDAVKVIKMNKTKDFITGIYPYHMMLSVFTPVFDPSSALKLTASVQEWCGHSFTQLNKERSRYRGQAFSYFEAEGDRSLDLTNAIPEDDFWNLIRIDPSQVPLGKVMLIPGLLDQRLTHVPLGAEEARVSIVDLEENSRELNIEYGHGNRTLKIRFQDNSPYEIIGWEEVRVLEDGNKEVTTAKRKAVLQVDYWNKNKLGDESFRTALKLKR